MKTIKRFFLSTAAVTAALITGCTPEEDPRPVPGGDRFILRVALNTGCTDLWEVRGTRNFLQ